MTVIERWWLVVDRATGRMVRGGNTAEAAETADPQFKTVEVAPAEQLAGLRMDMERVAVEDREHYRMVLSELLIYARGNPHLLDKIHTALDSPPSRGR